jgi:hypothetical protein
VWVKASLAIFETGYDYGFAHVWEGVNQVGHVHDQVASTCNMASLIERIVAGVSTPLSEEKKSQVATKCAAMADEYANTTGMQANCLLANDAAFEVSKPECPRRTPTPAPTP